LVDGVAGRLEAMRHPRVAAEHDQQVGVLDVLRRVAQLVAEQTAVHPEVAGLLLRQGVEVLGRAERVAERTEVGAAGVVALTAAAVESERLAPVRLPERLQACRDLRQRGLPRHRLVRAVGTPAERRRQTIGVRAVPVETLRLLAEIAL